MGGLCCDGGSCRRPTGTNGAACSDDSDCGVCGDCECDGDSGERRCVVETIRRSQADAFQNALECLVANDCEALDPLADGDVESSREVVPTSRAAVRSTMRT